MAWKCAATNRLLEHIQDETGPQSRYIVGKTKALEEISNILKDELGTRFNPVQISNKIRSLWREHRNHDYRGHKDTEFAVLFTEGRGILDSYTNSEVLRRRGSETGMISPLAKKTIKDLGLTPSLWTGRREGEKRRLPGRERRGRRRTAKTSEFAGSEESSHPPTPGGDDMPPFPLPLSGSPAGGAPPMIGNFGGTPSLPPNSRRLLPRPVGSPVQAASLPRIDEGQGQESRVSGQVPPRGELTSTPAAASRISVAGAQTHTLTQQSMGCRDFTPPLNPAPFSAEPRVSQSAIRRQIPHSIMEISPAARYSPVTPSHSPVTPPLGVRLHQSIHPQSTQEFSHPESMPPESDESGLMPRLEPSVPDSVQKIIDFIGSNPRQSLPNHDRLRDLGYSISICINKAVCNLLRAADTDPNKHDFHVIMHIPEAPFFQLCNCIYGVKSTDLLIERVSWIQVQSRLSLSNFLRSITAAAVYRWVLEEKPAGLPAKTKDLEIMEKNIAAVSPEFLDRLNWKMKYDSVQALQAHGDSSMTLPYRFLDSIRSFLQENLTICDKPTLLPFCERLSEVFSEARNLACQTSLKADELSFKWALSDTNFDPTIMKADDYTTPQGSEKVQVCLCPALIERKRAQLMSDGPRETVVFPALVSLQRLR